MELELSCTDPEAKQRVLEALADLGVDAASGPVRVAFPCTVVVSGVAVDDRERVLRSTARVDPGSVLVGGPDGRTGV